MCAPCKVVIDGGKVAATADLLADEVGVGHPLYASARYLAAIARADVAGVTLGMQIGTIQKDDVPSHWDGCHRATVILGWVEALRRQRVGKPLAAKEVDELAGAGAKMEEWAEADYQATLVVVTNAKG